MDEAAVGLLDGMLRLSVLGALLVLGGAIYDLDAWFQAACTGNLVLLQEMLAENAEQIDERSFSGHTALLYAVIHDRYKTVDYLLKRGASPYLSVYVRAIHAQRPCLPARCGAPPSACVRCLTVQNGNSALHMVGDLYDNVEMAQLLIDYGAPLTPTNRLVRAPPPARLAPANGECVLSSSLRMPAAVWQDAFGPCAANGAHRRGSGDP